MRRLEGFEDEGTRVRVRVRSACRSRRSRGRPGLPNADSGHSDGAASPSMGISIDAEPSLAVESVQDMLSACLPVVPTHITATELTVALFPMINAHLTQRNVHHPIQLQQALLRHANNLALEDENPIYLLPRRPSPIAGRAADAVVDPNTALPSLTLDPSDELPSSDHSDGDEDVIPWPRAYMPPIRGHIRLLTVPELDRLLHFYQLPVQGTLVERQTLLSLFLGLPSFIVL